MSGHIVEFDPGEPRSQAEVIEARIIAGADEVWYRLPGGQFVHVYVPKWYDAPIRRARIAWLRWRA